MSSPVRSLDSMDRPLSGSQLSSFSRFCEQATGRQFPDHASFHEFSVAERDGFWSLFLEWSELAWDGSPEPACTSDRCESAAFFPNLRLSYAENLLRPGVECDRTALTAHRPYSEPVRLTRGELVSRVLGVARQLTELGVGPGDRVVALAGNNAEAVIAGLATATIGAIFSSASPDMGISALLGRFAQLEPPVLMANMFSVGTAGLRPLDDHVLELVRGLPSLKALIALDEGPAPEGSPIPVLRLADLPRDVGGGAGDWPRFPFNHPLFVLFTSGTTGKPKCLVHGAGGTLLEHVKEHRLHVDLRPGERIFFLTSAAWMMWNWQLSALASGAELVLYDGPVSDPRTLWELVRAEAVNVFGTSPPYLQLCQDTACSPGPLPHLRTLLSTGSILHDWQYDWVYEQLGPVAVQSISGGTDIIGCFVLGNPDLPVQRGLIQCRSLGMDVQAMASDGGGSLAKPGTVGDLVCRNPFPSRPLGFFGDRGEQFRAAYFEENSAVWTHGDLIEFDECGQARMHGRSDGVMNIRGARIGPAEIYRALHDVEEILDAMAIELLQPDGQAAIALLVVLRPGMVLDSRLRTRIRRDIATNASPTHVPALIALVEDLPVTHSGKRSERAARDAVNGRLIGKPQGLANPQTLERIRAAVNIALERQRELDDAAGRSSEGPTEARVIEIWEVIFGIPVGPDDNFFELGGTSLMAVRLLYMIHERIGVELPPSVFVHSQSPAQIATLIDGPVERRAPILVPLRPGRGDRPLFVVHAMGGDVLHVRPLALALQTDRPVYGLQARGLDPRAEPDTTVEEMASTYVEVMRLVQPRGPYAIVGYSFGGLVAFEMARRLSAEGERVDTLALIDSYLNPACLSTRARWLFAVSRPLRYFPYIFGAPRTRARTVARNVMRRLARGGRRPGLHGPDYPRMPRWAQLEQIGLQAFIAYRPKPYHGQAVLFHARVRYPSFCDPEAAWLRYALGGLTRHRIDGDHGLVGEGSAGPVAELLSTQLKEAEALSPA